MEVVSLDITGFKLFDPSAQISSSQLKSFFNKASIESDKKKHLFNILVGIIFGLSKQDKERFRGNPELVKTFTGFLTLKTDERTLMIERDFETDFVACLLSDAKSTRPIFQGKDFVDNGYSRPYLQMLKSIFPLIVDKNLITEAFQFILEKEPALVLDALSLFFTPQFKFNSAKYLLNEAESLIAAYQKHKNEETYQKYELLRKGVLQTLTIKKQMLSLEQDLELLNRLLLTLNPELQNQEIIEQRFHSIKEFDPLKLRNDIMLWKSLREMKMQHEEELRALRFKKNRLTNIIDSDLYEYKNLPDSFSKEARRFKEIDLHLSGMYSHLKKYNDEIREIENSIDEFGKLKKFSLFTVPVLVFFIFYVLAGPVWTLIIPATLFVFLTLLAISGHSAYKKRSKIFRIQEEIDLLKKKINSYENDKKKLLQTYPLLKDTRYIDTHIERFRKFRQYLNELQTIQKKESAVLETLNAEPYSQKLAALEEKYKTRIDIQRPDLEEYLNEYVALKVPGKATQPKVETPLTRELHTLENKLKENVAELTAMQEKLVNAFHLDNGYSDLNRALKELDHKLNELRFAKWSDLPL